MNIVIIGSYPLSPKCIHGGVEASVYGLANELAKTSIVDVIDCPRINGTNSVERYSNLTIHRYTNPGKHNKDAVQIAPQIVRDIVALGPQVCHIHGTGLFSLNMFEAMSYYGIKTIVTVHGLLSVEKRNSLRKHFSLKVFCQYLAQTRAEKTLLNQCGHIIVDTAYVEATLKQYGLPQEPIMHVIPQGINEEYYKLHCSSESNVILAVGSISRRKGHLNLLRAFDELCSRGIDAKLVICGVVAEQSYLSAMRNYIAHSPNKNRITLKTNVTKSELADTYRSAHLFALHTEEESQGIVFAEAMACGLPIVATKVGGVPFVVRNQEEGLLSEFGDIKAFATNLKEMIENHEKWNDYSQSAIQRAKNYHWSIIAEKIEFLYCL